MMNSIHCFLPRWFRGLLVSPVVALCFSTPSHAGGISSLEPGGSPLETYGNLMQLGLPLAALAVTGFYGEPGDGRTGDAEGRWMLAKSYLSTMGTVFALKYGLDTERPNGGKHSFPSGHTASAFVGAAFLQERYGWEYGVPAYAMASLVGYSRVEADAHYPRDVLAAAAIAGALSYTFTDRWEKDVAISPWTDGEAVGLSLAFRF